MGSSLASHPDVPAPRRSPSSRCLRIRFQAGAWHLSEDRTGRVGGVFTSLSAAVEFARSELRGVPSSGVVLELGGDAGFDAEPYSTSPQGISV